MAGGPVIGFVLTVATTQAVAKTLLLVSATDPMAFGGVTASLAAVALVACSLPARGVTRVDPMVVLRHE